MAANEGIKSSVASMINGLDQFVSSKTVVGDPIHIDDTIIIPLVSVSFGMGAGSMGPKDYQAGGMGGRVSPNSVIVIHNGITRLINISTHSGMDRILDMVPDFVDRFTTARADKKEKQDRQDKSLSETARDKAAEAIRQKVSQNDQT